MITLEYDYNSVLEYASNIHRIAKEFRNPNPYGGMYPLDEFSSGRGKLAFMGRTGNQIYAEYFDDNDFHFKAGYISYCPNSGLKIVVCREVETRFIKYEDIEFMTEEMYFQKSLIYDAQVLNVILLYGTLLHHYKYKQKFFLDLDVYDKCLEYVNA